jgi:hypothetical protein
MIDMTNNRVPYGLLTDAEKAALHEHEKAGGEFIFIDPVHVDTVWPCKTPSWLDGVIYRTVPLPKTQDVIAWDWLPAWAEWVARDMNGSAFAYDEEPECRGDKWVFGGSECTRIDYWPGIVRIGTCDWRDSKQRRPR